MYSEDFVEPKKPNSGRRILLASVIINILLAMAAGALYNQNNMLQDEINDYGSELSKLSEIVAGYEQQLNMTLTQLAYYKDVSSQLSQKVTDGGISPGMVGTAVIPVVTVKTLQYGFSTTYEGEVLQADIELLHGEGRVLVDTEVINGADIQTSLRTAANVAAELTGVSFSGTDIILTIEGGSDVEIVDGPSAGAALTIAIYAAATGQEPQDGVYMTGTISSDGSVGKIGGVEYKGEAVGDNGGTVFLVPKGQSVLVTYQAVTKRMGRSTFTYYESVTVDLEDYLAEQGYDINVVEIGSIEDAIPYFFPA